MPKINSTTRRVDLHTHSTASDGELAPRDLVALALERDLDVIALTDHDSIAGIDAAMDAARATNLEVIPGVELSSDVEFAEVHMLGYFVDWRDADFLAMLAKFRDGRIGRAEKMVKKLNALGAPITFARVQEIAGDGSIGRPHVAQALVESGFVATINEAFAKYLARNAPAYVERFKITPEDSVALILRAGGVPVLAHPRDVSHYVAPLVKAGLVGLEVHYGMYDDALVSKHAHLAKQYGLIATGGSDFHGLEKMGHMGKLGQVFVPPEVVETLRERANEIKNHR